VTSSQFVSMSSAFKSSSRAPALLVVICCSSSSDLVMNSMSITEEWEGRGRKKDKNSANSLFQFFILQEVRNEIRQSLSYKECVYKDVIYHMRDVKRRREERNSRGKIMLKATYIVLVVEWIGRSCN